MNPNKTWGLPRRVSNSCFTCETCHVPHFLLHMSCSSVPASHVRHVMFLSSCFTSETCHVPQFLLHMWDMSCSSCYEPGDKSWMRKRLYCDYHKWNICVVMWHKYSIVVNQDMVVTAKRSKWRLQLDHYEPLVQQLAC